MIRLGLFAAVALALAGCGDKTQPSKFDNKDKDGHDHSQHERGTIRLEDATLPGGKKCHAGLTAHLSEKEGNELDLLFETMDKDPKPLTVPEKTKITARVTRKGDDKAYTLEFAPAEKDERKTDPDGQCSRFTAKAPWMKADDELDVTVTIEGVDAKIPWVKFLPSKYGHKH